MNPNHDYQDFDMNDAGMTNDLIEYDQQYPSQEIDLGLWFENADHSLQTLPPGDTANNTPLFNDNNMQDLIAPIGFGPPEQNGFHAPQPVGPPPLQQQQAVYQSGWYPAEGHVPFSMPPLHPQQQQAVYPSSWYPTEGHIPSPIVQRYPQQQQAVYPSNRYPSQGYVPSPTEPQSSQQEQVVYPFGGLQTPNRQKAVCPSSDYHPRIGWWQPAQPREEGASFNVEIGWYKVVAPPSIRPPSAAPSIKSTAIDASNPIDGDLIGERFVPVLNKTQPRVQRQPHNRSISPRSDASQVTNSKRSIVQDCTCKLKLRQSIPRPKNAFILFRSQHAQAFEAMLKSEGMTTVTNADISSRAGKQWNKASLEEKEKWRQMAVKEKKEHQEKYPDYKYQPKTKHDVRFGSPSCKCGAYEVNMEHNRQTHNAIDADTPETVPEGSQAKQMRQIGIPSMADQDARMDSEDGSANDELPVDAKSAPSRCKPVRKEPDQDARMGSDDDSAGDELPADDNPAPVRSKPVRQQAEKRKRNVENKYADSPRRSKRLTKTKTSYLENAEGEHDDDVIVVSTSKSKAKAKDKGSKPREQYNIVPLPPSPDHSESDDEDIVIPHRGPPWYLNLPDRPKRR